MVRDNVLYLAGVIIGPVEVTAHGKGDGTRDDVELVVNAREAFRVLLRANKVRMEEALLANHADDSRVPGVLRVEHLGREVLLQAELGRIFLVNKVA